MLKAVGSIPIRTFVMDIRTSAGGFGGLICPVCFNQGSGRWMEINSVNSASSILPLGFWFGQSGFSTGVGKSSVIGGGSSSSSSNIILMSINIISSSRLRRLLLVLLC